MCLTSLSLNCVYWPNVCYPNDFWPKDVEPRKMKEIEGFVRLEKYFYENLFFPVLFLFCSSFFKLDFFPDKRLFLIYSGMNCIGRSFELSWVTSFKSTSPPPFISANSFIGLSVCSSVCPSHFISSLSTSPSIFPFLSPLPIYNKTIGLWKNIKVEDWNTKGSHETLKQRRKRLKGCRN